MADDQNGLSVWHLTMMALGTVVGGSFFLGSAIAIRTAGPAILISYLLGGVLIYIILTALSEMTVANQAPGSFRTFAEEMFGPAVGFVLGWSYWTGLTLAISSEATAAAVLIGRWIPGIALPLIASLIIILVTLLNLVGARTLSTLESGLAVIKLSAIAIFIIIGIGLIGGFFGQSPVGLGALRNESLLPNGFSGIAGSMLIVIFTYAGFEIIGLAASEAENPHDTVPRAILYTVLGLVGLYTIAITVLLPLVPTGILTEEVSPLVSGLTNRGLIWAAGIINVVLLIAILSTMLAAMFGLGRMIRSLAEKGYAPHFMNEKGKEVPIRGILFSGIAMLIGMSSSYILPSQFYIFLVSSGGFILLFTYVVIMATHYKYRKQCGCPPKGHCQLFGFPYTSILTLIGLAAIIISMPLVPGQGSGLIAGLLLIGFYSLAYLGFKYYKKLDVVDNGKLAVNMEVGDEIVPEEEDE